MTSVRELPLLRFEEIGEWLEHTIGDAAVGDEEDALALMAARTPGDGGGGGAAGEWAVGAKFGVGGRDVLVARAAADGALELVHMSPDAPLRSPAARLRFGAPPLRRAVAVGTDAGGGLLLCVATARSVVRMLFEHAAAGGGGASRPSVFCGGGRVGGGRDLFHCAGFAAHRLAELTGGAHAAAAAGAWAGPGTLVLAVHDEAVPGAGSLHVVEFGDDAVERVELAESGGVIARLWSGLGGGGGGGAAPLAIACAGGDGHEVAAVVYGDGRLRVWALRARACVHSLALPPALGLGPAAGALSAAAAFAFVTPAAAGGGGGGGTLTVWVQLAHAGGQSPVLALSGPAAGGGGGLAPGGPIAPGLAPSVAREMAVVVAVDELPAGGDALSGDGGVWALWTGQEAVAGAGVAVRHVGGGDPSPRAPVALPLRAEAEVALAGDRLGPVPEEGGAGDADRALGACDEFYAERALVPGRFPRSVGAAGVAAFARAHELRFDDAMFVRPRARVCVWGGWGRRGRGRGRGGGAHSRAAGRVPCRAGRRRRTRARRWCTC